jgi:hypothetical protein
MKIRVYVTFLVVMAALSARGDSKFFLIKTIEEIDAEADGTALPFRVVSYSYQDGVVVGSVSELDETGDGIMDRRSISTLTYDDQGRPYRDQIESYDISTGTVESRSTITREYDSRGNQAGSVIEADANADGTLDYISSTTIRYDEGNNLIGRVTEADRGADGTWDDVDTLTRTYDAGDNLVLQVREVDNGRDGQVEKRETWRFTVDSRGNRTLAVHEIDFEADGVVDFNDRTVCVYDRQRRLQSSTTEYGYSFEEGILERSLSTSTYFYDRHGNRIRIVQENDAYADGLIDEIRITTRTYARLR